jgi:hypothetical protein
MGQLDFHTIFNEKMLEFATDLCNVFPDVTEFKRFRSGVIMLQNVNPKTLETIFRTYVLLKYKDKILSKNEDFFLEHNEFEIHSQKTDYWLTLIEEIKKMWVNLDTDNKDTIWKYLQIMIILSEKCHSS